MGSLWGDSSDSTLQARTKTAKQISSGANEPSGCTVNIAYHIITTNWVTNMLITQLQPSNVAEDSFLNATHVWIVFAERNHTIYFSGRKVKRISVEHCLQQDTQIYKLLFHQRTCKISKVRSVYSTTLNYIWCIITCNLWACAAQQ